MTSADHVTVSADISITPTLFFHGNGAEAAEFYTSLFPNSRTIRTSPSPYGPNPLTHLLSLNSGAVTLLLIDVPLSAQPPCKDDSSSSSSTKTASDPTTRTPPWKFNESFSLTLLVSTQAEIDRLWTQLTSNGGKSKECCWCEDRFGVSWQVVPRLLVECNEEGGEKGKRAGKVMMGWRGERGGKPDLGELVGAVEKGE